MSVRRASVLATLVVGATAASAHAAEPLETASNTAPAYPGNTVSAAFVQDGPIVAATNQVVQLSGHAEFKDDLTTYTPSVFLQNADVDPSCGATLDQQRQKYINNTAVSASAGFSPWVMDEGQYTIAPNGSPSLDWSTRTQPFVIRTGVSKVLLCSYTRYIVDDVAGFAARYSVQQPACKPTSGKVRRGRSLTLKCNFSGKVSVRLSRGSKKVTRTVTISSRTERGRFSTKGARAGVNRIAFSLDGKHYGRPLSVRVR